MSEPLQIFMSYSSTPEDDELAGQLRKHFSPLTNHGSVQVLDRSTLLPGDCQSLLIDWLNRADMILMLITPDSLADVDCVQERKLAVERRERGNVHLIPILLRPGMFELEPWKKLKRLPSNGKAVTEYRERDRAFLDIARGIRAALDRIIETRKQEIAASSLKTSSFFLNHTSFLRPALQKKFQRLTGVPLPHYDIRVIVDAYDQQDLDQVERVEYILDPTYPKPVQVCTEQHRPEKFLLKELANGEYILRAHLYMKNGAPPISLERYITLWASGPELP